MPQGLLGIETESGGHARESHDTTLFCSKKMHIRGFGKEHFTYLRCNFGVPNFPISDIAHILFKICKYNKN